MVIIIIKIHSSQRHQVHCGITWQYWCTISYTNFWGKSWHLKKFVCPSWVSSGISILDKVPKKGSNYTGNFWCRYLTLSFEDSLHAQTKGGFQRVSKNTTGKWNLKPLEEKGQKKAKVVYSLLLSKQVHIITFRASNHTKQVPTKHWGAGETNRNVVPEKFNQAKGYN